MILFLFLSITGEEGVRTLASIKHAHTLRLPSSSFSQSACVIVILIMLNVVMLSVVAPKDQQGLSHVIRLTACLNKFIHILNPRVMNSITETRL